MIKRRPRELLNKVDFGAFRAVHHFVTGSPTDNPAHQPVGGLVVWNDDEIDAGEGVGFHPHANVEIITYVREGEVQHRDSLGNSGTLDAGDVQVMSAGTGLQHAETCHHSTKIFQIWIRPLRSGGLPSWEIRRFPKTDRHGHFVALASGYADDEGAAPIRADARVSGAILVEGQTAKYHLAPSRKAYVVPSRGRVTVNGIHLEERDGAVVEQESELIFQALDDAEIVLVEVA